MSSGRPPTSARTPAPPAASPPAAPRC